MRYVEERQRRRWPRAAITRRAQGGCGLIQRQNSSPMLSHRDRRPSLSEPRKTPARDPLYFFNNLLVGQTLHPRHLVALTVGPIRNAKGLAKLRVDLPHHVRVLDEELAHVLLPLSKAKIPVRVPRPGLLHELELGAQINQESRVGDPPRCT